MTSVIGWDIGGVNTKAALIADGIVERVISRPFELQRAPDTLAALLADIAHALNPGPVDAHAVTMTAELSQMFRSKREGVGFVLDAVDRAFPGATVRVYTTHGGFVSPDAARTQPLDVAAANWVATAHLVARHHPDALLIDIGTTTTDVIPIANGRVVARGRTDPARLASGELVYSGVVRTPVEAVVDAVPLDNGPTRVSAEGFALTGDVHVWLGNLAPEDYEAATPDGRPPTRVFAGERLARVVCADSELLSEDAISRIAEAVAHAQVRTIADAIRQVAAGNPALDTAVVTGLGAFLGARAAAAAGLTVASLSDHLGSAGARSAPAAAVGLLLNDWGEAGRASRSRPGVTVVKLGGSLLADPQQWRTAVATLAASTSERLLIVPGGGPFADAVRGVDEQFRLPDTVAHWMAIAGMDQHAEMIAAASPHFARVLSPAEMTAAHRRGLVAVLAPLQWLREADPLPHSWDVTSDSIAAWVAAQVNATRLVVVKSAGAAGPTSVDPRFSATLPPQIPCVICEASALGAQWSAPEPSRR